MKPHQNNGFAAKIESEQENNSSNEGPYRQSPVLLDLDENSKQQQQQQQQQQRQQQRLHEVNNGLHNVCIQQTTAADPIDPNITSSKRRNTRKRWHYPYEQQQQLYQQQQPLQQSQQQQQQQQQQQPIADKFLVIRMPEPIGEIVNLQQQQQLHDPANVKTQRELSQSEKGLLNR
uniref:Uncharacterized protein n=1 Tax=Trichogramma kaykai TaxID=54128 RepID=A0ABD2X1T8_9HYME